MSAPAANDVATALKRLGHYRVSHAVTIAGEVNDGIGGAHILALGLRETWGKNIEGGAMLVNGVWVPETNPARMDVGWLQISRRYHPGALRLMPGVKDGTWTPAVDGWTAVDSGYVPQFTPALRFTLDAMGDAIAFAEDHAVPKAQRARFAIAAHNAGLGGALNGYRAGDVDKFTASGDYSGWVLAAKKLVDVWLKTHPSWKVP